MKNQIPPSWQKVKLGEVAKITTGSTNSVDADDQGIYPFFDRSMIIKKSNKYLFDGEAVIIPGEGKEFIPRYYKGKFDLHQRAYALFGDKNKIICKYLYYLMVINNKYLSKVAVGSTVKSLRLPIFKNLELKIPSLDIQEKISFFLSAFDDKIELNNKIAKTLEDMAQAIFKEWFVKKVNSEKLKVKGEKLQNWELKKADELLVFEKGFDVGSNKYQRKENKDNLLFIRVGDLGDNISGSRVYIKSNISNIKLCKENDILLSLDGTVGRVKIGLSGAFSGGIRKVYSKNKSIKKSFIYFWLKSSEVQQTIKENAEGAVILHASKAINYLKINFNKVIIEKFSKIAEPIFYKIVSIKTENQKLAQMRDFLLPKLMKGEIRIKN